MCFFNEYIRRIEKAIDIIIALVSSASVAAWKFWEAHPSVWASIIFIGQLIIFFKPYFPYLVNKKSFDELYAFYLSHKDSWSELWHKYEKGLITENDALEEYSRLKKETTQATINKISVKAPEWNMLRKKAELETELYLKHYL